MALAPRNHPRSDEPLFAGPIDIRSVALTGLFVLATVYTLYFARSFLLPIVLAMLLSFLFAPLIRALKRFGVPEAVSAAAVLVTLIGGATYGVYALSTPASTWIAAAPDTLRKLDDKVRTLRKPVQKVSQAAEQVEHMATVAGDAKVQKVEVQQPGLTEILFSRTQGFLAGALVTFVLLYFLLASGDLFLRKLVRILPTLEDKKVAVEVAHQIEGHISRYLLTVTMINVALGAIVAVVCAVVGMPNAVLWGVMVGTFNFVPYVGPFASMVVLAVVGISTFDSLGHALLTPGIYFCIDAIEANVITPSLLGHHLSLNPVVIFVGVTFWGWLWGIAGALLAVPMLAAFKILCDEIKPLATVGEFLGP